MSYRNKRIGKSIYEIIKVNNYYMIQETLCTTQKKYISGERWEQVQDALTRLNMIDRERFYSDDSFRGCLV